MSLKLLIKKVLKNIKHNTNLVINFLYHKLPIPQKFKNSIKMFLFENFSVLFRGTKAYLAWENLNVIKITKDNLPQFLPSKINLSPFTSNFNNRAVDIIVPVYKGLRQTQNCIESVFNSNLTTPYRIILINDCSPEQEVTDYLRSISKKDKVTLLENKSNLGFTETVNIGMSLSQENDIVLLNSDTVVANDWLDKLKLHCHSKERIGTVTPFSNNATICSFPTLDGTKQLPHNLSINTLDSLFYQANKGRHTEIPTAVGFCMYIRRECLTETGFFDVEAFGKGYGEENDFCLRAINKGWVNVLAADTFVFHEGEVSFQENSNPRKLNAMKVITSRYPNYEREVANHVRLNPALPFRFAAIAAILKNDSRPKIIQVVHALGGGTQKHVDMLTTDLRSQIITVQLSSFISDYGILLLHIKIDDDLLKIDIKLPTYDVNYIVDLLKSLNPSGIHIHHLLNINFQIKEVINQLNIPFVLTLHDYFYICPFITLTQKGNYCGEPGTAGCNNCISTRKPNQATDILSWRQKYKWFFDHSSWVICPSIDVYNRYFKYFPNANYRVVYHENQDTGTSEVKLPEIHNNEFRVAILGSLISHKGLYTLTDTLSLFQKNQEKVTFKLIGSIHEKMKSFPKELFSATGFYDDTDLDSLIESFNPHLILFLSRCPETYSYTLTSALKNRRAIATPKFGAFTERLINRSWTWLFNPLISPQDLYELLNDIKNKYIKTKNQPPLTLPTENNLNVDVKNFDNYYRKHYINSFKKE